jgi:hypothetical protein
MTAKKIKKNGIWRGNEFKSTVSIPEYSELGALKINHYQVLPEKNSSEKATHQIITHIETGEGDEQLLQVLLLRDLRDNNALCATATVNNPINQKTQEIIEFFAHTDSSRDEIVFVQQLVRD